MTTDEATRVAIAECVGWKIVECHAGKDIPLHLLAWERGRACVMTPQLPDYLNSRDACAEFEATLTEEKQWAAYWASLDEVCGYPRRLFFLVTASPRARCEAFVKTMGLEARIKELTQH